MGRRTVAWASVTEVWGERLKHRGEQHPLHVAVCMGHRARYSRPGEPSRRSMCHFTIDRSGKAKPPTADHRRGGVQRGPALVPHQREGGWVPWIERIAY